MTKEDEKVNSEIAKLEAFAEEWVSTVGWREQLNMIAAMSTTFAGNRVKGPGGPECKMLILRQRNMIDRWVRQAFIEGLMAGLDSRDASRLAQDKGAEG